MNVINDLKNIKAKSLLFFSVLISSFLTMPLTSDAPKEIPVKKQFLFTSESVGEGHPDKLCDQISDAILDACLKQDPNSKVACETAVKTNLVVLLGEITTNAQVNYEAVARETIKQVGYDSEELGFDYKTCKVILAIEDQAPEIAQAVHINKSIEEIGAGDQGLMFGYATDETEEAMPLTIVLAHKLNKKLSEFRKDGTLAWLRPDSKSQVTVAYEEKDGALIPLYVHTVVISTQHDESISLDEIKAQLIELVVKEVVPSEYLTEDTIFHINPSGSFLIGGPASDAGLTGRKIIVDTYGGWGAHGGGAFSGKDSSKVDRSAAYSLRWIAKSLVKAKLCKRVLVQASYAIGVAEPIAIHVNSFGTSQSDEYLLEVIKKNFDLRPGVIIKDLELTNPCFQETASYGHFGSDRYVWENAKELIL